MRVTIEELQALMSAALALRGVEREGADFMIADYLESELEGHKTHGVSKFLLLDAALQQRLGEVKIVKQCGNYAKVDGNRELGHIAALKSVNLGLELAKEHGNSFVSLKNASRYSRVTPFARKIAQAGYLAIITNNGGPACVAPFGGGKAIFGTNPLCFAFPGGDKPYIFDFATSQKVWGEVRQAIVENRPLPEGCFLDADGQPTTDPQRAEAGVPFGGPKGYALCYALELLTGAFVEAEMGAKAQDEYDLGFLFMILSPEMFTDSQTFCTKADELAAEVRACPPTKAGGRVFVPGDPFGDQLQKNLASGMAEIEDDVYERLKRMSVSLEGGFESSKKLN